MARLGQLAFCASTAVSAADVPQLRGRQLQSCNEISSNGYKGYNNKNSGDSDGQWNDPVDGSNNEWWKCAQKCNDNGGCAGWTFVYDGSSTNQRQCWLKPTLVSTDCNSWAPSGDVISGLGQQVEDCNEISSNGYTGYNNKDNGPSDGQWNDPVDGSNNDWWKCAQKCNDNGGCAGWTFVYDGSGTNQRQCWLKPTLVSTDCNSWAPSADDISGLGNAELQLQGQQVEAGNSTSANLQSANTYCSDPLDVQGPHAASCQWMKTDGDDCQNSDDDACRCRDYNTVQQRCTGCSVNPCQKRFCFDIIDLPDNNCQWMYNEGDDCTSTDDKAEACRQANAHSCAPCPR